MGVGKISLAGLQFAGIQGEKERNLATVGRNPTGPASGRTLAQPAMCCLPATNAREIPQDRKRPASSLG